MRRRLLALAVVALAGCGGEEEAPPRAQETATPTPAATATATAKPKPRKRRRTPPPLYSQRPGCRPAGGNLRFCVDRKVFGSVHSESGRVPVRRPGVGIGRWVWAAASPDGRQLLMQWSGECEVPLAFLVPAQGGRPRRLVGKHVNSYALGWTTDGRAIVFVPAQPGCGAGEDAGLFLIGPGGDRERIGPAAKRPPIRPSVRPRDAKTLRGV